MDDETRQEQASAEVRARVRSSFERQGLMSHLVAQLTHVATGQQTLICVTARPDR